MNSFFFLHGNSVNEANGKVILSAQITIDKNHKIFEGHFPQQPVVPGVCMVQIIKEILENHLSVKLFLTSASNIKFLSVINPEVNSELKVDISYVNSVTNFSVDAGIFCGDLTFFKIKGVFQINNSSKENFGVVTKD